MYIVKFTRSLCIVSVLLTCMVYFMPLYANTIVNYIANDLGNNWVHIYTRYLIGACVSACILHIMILTLVGIGKILLTVYATIYNNVAQRVTVIRRRLHNKRLLNKIKETSKH
jgi:uncharacterized membrane protein